jgi:hypothetical protein
MSKIALRIKGLDCSGTSKTLITESNILGELDLGNLLDCNEDTLPSVCENCNSSQPSIMGSNIRVEDIALPMASLSKLEDTGKVSASFTSLCLGIQQCIDLCPMNLIILHVRWQRFK